MDAQKDFEAACEQAKQLTWSHEQMGALYGLYKQATVGDVAGDRPGMLSLTARAKWDAWSQHRGLGAEEAAARYVALVRGRTPEE